MQEPTADELRAALQRKLYSADCYELFQTELECGYNGCKNLLDASSLDEKWCKFYDEGITLGLAQEDVKILAKNKGWLWFEDEIAPIYCSLTCRELTIAAEVFE